MKSQRSNIISPSSDAVATADAPVIDPLQIDLFPDATLTMISLADIDREGNHRHPAAIDQQQLKDLADSIQSAGLLQPIGVFHHPDWQQRQLDGLPIYQLGFGFRRAAACELLGRTEILARVFPAAKPWEIERARALENLARHDLNPIEELIAVAQLVKACNGSVDLAAGRLGRSAKWVRDRLYLERLDPQIRQMIHDGKINMAHARELSKLPDRAIQVDVAQYVERCHHDMSHGTPDQWFCDQVSRRMRQLNEAPWSLSLPLAGQPACNVCPDNTANDLMLFGETAEPMCVNRQCYASKYNAAEVLMRKAVKDVAGDKLTIKDAKKIAPAELKPEALVKEVKHRTRPAETTPEETPQQKVEREAKIALEQAEDEYFNKIREIFDGAVLAKPERLLILRYMRECSVFEDQLNEWRNKEGIFTPAAEKLFMRLMKFDQDAVDTLMTELRNDGFSVYVGNYPAPIVQRIYEALGIIDQIPPEPKLEDFLKPVPTPKPRKGKAAAAGMDMDESDDA